MGSSSRQRMPPEPSTFKGAVGERLSSGLQIRECRFDSGRRLQCDLQRKSGREAESGGLLNRYASQATHRGFESLLFRQERGESRLDRTAGRVIHREIRPPALTSLPGLVATRIEGLVAAMRTFWNLLALGYVRRLVATLAAKIACFLCRLT